MKDTDNEINDDCLVIVPVYNGEETITKTIKNLEKYFKNILVINDGSDDCTLDLIKNNNLKFINHLINIGQGGALESGMLFFIKKTNFKYLITFDADGQHIAKEAFSLLSELKNKKAYACIGSRFKNKNIKIPLIKRIILKLACIYEKFFFSIKLTDAHNGLRAISRDLVKNNLLPLKNYDMSHATEISHKICLSGKHFIEYPVNILYDEKASQSPLNGINILLRLFLKFNGF